MPEYRRHAFEKDWHDKVEEFIEQNDLAFDSPKYFIKFCVNKYMDEYSDDRYRDLSFSKELFDDPDGSLKLQDVKDAIEEIERRQENSE